MGERRTTLHQLMVTLMLDQADEAQFKSSSVSFLLYFRQLRK